MPYGPERDRFFRHAEHDTACLILGNGLSAAVEHLQQTLSPIIPHTRHNHTYRVRSSSLGNRSEQHIHTGPVA